MSKLNKKYQAFVDEYMINGFNINAAYSKVYPKASKESVEANASRLMANDGIKEAIRLAQEENRAKYDVTKDEIIGVVKSIMTAKDFNPVHTANLKAAELLNKMFGFNAVDKSEITIKQEQPLFPPTEDAV